MHRPVLAEHVCPVVHALHEPPLSPHAAALDPATTHVPSDPQQPFAHVIVAHAAGSIIVGHPANSSAAPATTPRITIAMFFT